MRGLSRVLAGVFFAACLFALYKALAPTGDGWSPWDKALHFSTFYVLAGLGALGFPRLRIGWLALGLAAFGAAIEGLQALPMVHRDAEWGDWIADLIGVGAALGPMLAPGLRRWLGRR